MFLFLFWGESPNPLEKFGKDYLTSNIENEEFSYQKALKEIGKDITEYHKEYYKRKYKNVDIRFENGGLSILVETTIYVRKIQEIDKRKIKNQRKKQVDEAGAKCISFLSWVRHSTDSTGGVSVLRMSRTNHAVGKTDNLYR